MYIKLFFSILFTTVLIFSCEKKEEPIEEEEPPTIDISSLPATVGDYRQGGVVFWVNPADSTQGLVIAKNDLFASIRWGCAGTAVGNVNAASLTNLFGGEQNTADILYDCNSADCAAYYSNLDTIDGYSDWWLPNTGEWTEIIENLEVIEGVCDTIPGGKVFYDKYWSSNQAGGVLAEDLAGQLTFVKTFMIWIVKMAFLLCDQLGSLDFNFKSFQIAHYSTFVVDEIGNYWINAPFSYLGNYLPSMVTKVIGNMKQNV